MIERAAVWIATAFMIAATPALAADPWPVRPVTVICPFPPGISTDILTRAVATALSNALGQQFVMENRPGANGNIGAATAAKAAPDGYTFLVATLGPDHCQQVHVQDHELRRRARLCAGRAARLLAADHRRQPEMPAANFRELVAYARQNPGRLNAGTVGHGSQAHITLELINKLAGTSIVHVPYRIATQALPDLISGDLQVGFNYIPTFVPAVQEGTIRGLAVTSLARLSDLPNVPTVDEFGFPGFEASGWNALLAPAGTPREIIDKVNAIVNAFLKSDDGKLQLRKLGITPLGGTPEELQAHLDRERAKWGPIIKEANISLQ